jgi:hypothetical protein
MHTRQYLQGGREGQVLDNAQEALGVVPHVHQVVLRELLRPHRVADHVQGCPELVEHPADEGVLEGDERGGGQVVGGVDVLGHVLTQRANEE